MQILREKGWVCSRSAMSHGPVDVFAAKGGKILLIQVKSGSARAKKSELEVLKKWAVAFDARAEVWSYKGRGKLERTVVRVKVSKTSKRIASSGDGRMLELEKIQIPTLVQPVAISSSIQPASGSQTIPPL